LWKYQRNGSNVMQATQLGLTRTFSPYTETWVRVTLRVTGTTVAAELYRPDTNQYLSTTGVWQSTPVNCFSETDSALSVAGPVGVQKPNTGAGPVTFDDFSANGVAALPPPAPTGIALSQANFASGPYVLDQDNKTYYLTENITVNGTAFVNKANGVILGL
jgi:hypothetical protein